MQEGKEHSASIQGACGGEAHPGVGVAVLEVSAGVQREKDFVSVDQKQYYSEPTDLPQSQIIAWEL